MKITDKMRIDFLQTLWKENGWQDEDNGKLIREIQFQGQGWKLRNAIDKELKSADKQE